MCHSYWERGRSNIFFYKLHTSQVVFHQLSHQQYHLSSSSQPAANRHDTEHAITSSKEQVRRQGRTVGPTTLYQNKAGMMKAIRKLTSEIFDPRICNFRHFNLHLLFTKTCNKNQPSYSHWKSILTRMNPPNIYHLAVILVEKSILRAVDCATNH